MFRKIKYSIIFYKYQVNRQNWWIMLYFNLLSNNWMNYIQQGLPTSSLCIVSLTLWFLRRHWHMHSLKKYCIVIDGFCFIWVESKKEGGGGVENKTFEPLFHIEVWEFIHWILVSQLTKIYLVYGLLCQLKY